MNALTKNLILMPFNLLYRISPVFELKLLYLLKKKRRLHLNAPRYFTEKLQWIKLYDKNPLMPVCCDKYTVREFVKEQGLEHLLNELYWSGFDPEEIPFDELPDKFVVKVTHGSSFNIIVKDKSKLDRASTVKKLKKWMNSRFLPCYGEWFYGIERPRVIVEKYLESEDNDLPDYKVMCFNGEPKIIHMHVGRYGDHKMDIYDADWNFLADKTNSYENSGNPVPRPACLDSMLEYARILSKPFLHARVDFYIVGDSVVFGELTFTASAGFANIKPEDFDLEMGSWLKLPIDK